ncbi:MAG: hypothetical protein ABI678_24020, partial [Kofleriaceae bacterium]
MVNSNGNGKGIEVTSARLDELVRGLRQTVGRATQIEENVAQLAENGESHAAAAEQLRESIA